MLLVILRGLPGSGKTTWAKSHKSPNGLILSADDFFIDPDSGKYNYNHTGLKAAHIWCQEKCRIAMKDSVDQIIIDNTNLKIQDMCMYAKLAKEYAYKIKFVDMDPLEITHDYLLTLASRNKHKVPLQNLEKLAREKHLPKGIQDLLDFKHYKDDKKLRQKWKRKLESQKSKSYKVLIPEKTKSVEKFLIQIAPNNGQGSPYKPIVITPFMDFSKFCKLCCQKHKLSFKKGKSIVYTQTGDVISDISQMCVPNQKFIIERNGKPFIAMALRQRRKPKRAYLQIPQKHRPIPSVERLPKGTTHIVDNIYVGSMRDYQCERTNKDFGAFVNCAADWPTPPKQNVHFIPLYDVPEQTIAPFLQKFCAILSDLDHTCGVKVLVHCISGKSRSVTLILCYLMMCKKMTLKGAWTLVVENRPIARPNMGFWRQLLNLECVLFGVNSLHWLDILGDMEIEDWLKASTEPERYNPTHMWWLILSKDQFSIPLHRLDELDVLYKRDVDLGKNLHLVENNAQPRYKFWIDSDVNCANESMDLVELLKSKIFSIMDELPFGNANVIVTGAKGPFKGNIRYGYHLIWDVYTTFSEHKDCLERLLDRRPDLRDFIDVNIFNNDSGLRMIHTSKWFSCRKCKKRRFKKPNPKCDWCFGDGKLPTRLHQFLGIWNKDGCISKKNTTVDEYSILPRDFVKLTNQAQQEVWRYALGKTCFVSHGKRKRELMVVRWLRENGGNLELLAKKFAIRHKKSRKHRNLVQLFYSSKHLEQPIVQECRGLILDGYQNWQVVAFPFRKFFNIQDKLAHAIDWSNAVCEEKLDGCIMTMYHYANGWHVASSHDPDAGELQQLFWDIWNSTYGKTKRPTNIGLTYIFEMLSARHQIICDVPRDRIVFLGCRDIENYQEVDPQFIAASEGFEQPTRFHVFDPDKVKTMAENLDCRIAEGFVVRDANFGWVKIKCSKYVELANSSRS